MVGSGVVVKDLKMKKTKATPTTYISQASCTDAVDVGSAYLYPIQSYTNASFDLCIYVGGDVPSN